MENFVEDCTCERFYLAFHVMLWILFIKIIGEKVLVLRQRAIGRDLATSRHRLILHFHQYNAVIHFFPIKVSPFLLHNSLILGIGLIRIHIFSLSLSIGLCFLIGSTSRKIKDGVRTTLERIKRHLNSMPFIPHWTSLHYNEI